MAVQIQYKDVLDAAHRIRDDLRETPLLKSPKLSEELGMEIYLKMEHTLPTKSIKDRSACYIMKSLSQEDRRKGVIAVVGGNLALALAYQGKLHNVPVTLVLPNTFRFQMIPKLKEYGATVELHNQGILEAKEYAKILAEKRGLQYINSYNDPLIIAGQGTAALEIIEQMDELGVQVDAVIIPVGGGGLLAGMAMTLKHLRSDVKVIAVESELCDSFSAAKRAGRPVRVPDRFGLAGGLRAPMVGTNAFATARNNIDEVCVVDEDSIACSISKLFEVEEITIEGAGACGLAACLFGQLHQHLSGKNVVVMLTGGNIDKEAHEKCLKRGQSIYGDKKATHKTTIEDSALDVAITNEEIEEVQSPLEINAETYLKNNEEQTAFKTAKEHDHKSIISLSAELEENTAYPGILFSKGVKKESITSDEKTINLEDVGISVTFPENSLPSTDQPLEITIQPCFSGSFEMPDGIESVSPAYLIKCNRKITLLKDAILMIRHYANLQTEEDCKNMVFLSARSTPEYRGSSPVYVFKEITDTKGLFRPGQEKPLGEIRMRHFCIVTTGRNKPLNGNSSKLYSARLFRTEKSAVFCMCLYQPLYMQTCKEVITREYTGIQGPSVDYDGVTLSSNEVTIRASENNEWNVTFQKTKISRAEIESQEKYLDNIKELLELNYPPRIDIGVTLISVTPNPKPLELLVVGLNEDYIFNLHPGHYVLEYPLISPQVLPHSSVATQGSNLTTPNIKKILKDEDFSADNAEELGTFLGINKGRISTLRINSISNADQLLTAIIEEWLRNDKEKSWKKLADAVRNCHYPLLADKILEQYCGEKGKLFQKQQQSSIQMTPVEKMGLTGGSNIIHRRSVVSNGSEKEEVLRKDFTAEKNKVVSSIPPPLVSSQTPSSSSQSCYKQTPATSVVNQVSTRAVQTLSGVAVLALIELNECKACVRCEREVTQTSEKLGNCTKCRAKQLMSRCKTQLMAKLCIEADQVKRDVQVFGDVVAQICRGKEISEESLLEADPFTCNIDSENVLTDVRHHEM